MHSQTPLSIDVCGEHVVPFKCISADNHVYRVSQLLRADSILLSRTGYIAAYRVGEQWFRTSVHESVGVTRRAKVLIRDRQYERAYDEEKEHVVLEGEIELCNQFAPLLLVVDGVMHPFVALVGNKDCAVRFTLQATRVPIGDTPAALCVSQITRANKCAPATAPAAPRTVTVQIDVYQYKEGEKAAFSVRSAAQVEEGEWAHAEPIVIVTRAKPMPKKKRALDPTPPQQPVPVIRPVPVRPIPMMCFEPAPQFLVPLRPIAVRPAKRAHVDV